MRTEALVIGGGPAGTATAILLARAGWSVTIVEKRSFPRRKVCGEYLSATSLSVLDLLDVGAAFANRAGPPVERVGLFAGNSCLETDLPRHDGAFGRALSREVLDSLLMQQAERCGVSRYQPCTVTAFQPHGDGVQCALRREQGRDEVDADIVVAAHGSWSPGPLPTQAAHQTSEDSDLFGFKAHFISSKLPKSLMPLLAFPGGYGGMVHTDGGRLSFSCCVRRATLDQARSRFGDAAGEALLAHVMHSCRGVREALDGARRDGDWLAAGPIRPGIRLRDRGRIFCVGNAAGEAHPVVAEGISMAIQSAWLLAQRLIAWRRDATSLTDVARDYAADWRRAFAPRLFASRVIAEWAMRPFAVRAVVPIFQLFPGLLQVAVRCSGKTTRVVHATTVLP